MTVKEIIICLSKQAGLTQAQLAARLGSDRAATVSVPLSRHMGMSMKVETLLRWVEALDAQIVIQSLDGEDELILDGEEEGVSY